ncbi:uncharacterized protein [Taeniopygia guttata]|uniref:uncharacterized protein isoform X1 n=1 Tax=Taeniopygia guttata TaxID=59729 RepID=UPI003BB905A2
MGGSLSQWEAAEAGPAHSTPPVPPSKAQLIPVQASSSQYSPSAPPVPPSAAQFAPVPPSISQFYQCHSQFVPVHPSLSQCIPVPLPVCPSAPSIPQCHSQFIPVSPSSSQSFRGQASAPPPYLATPLPLVTPPRSVPRPLPFPVPAAALGSSVPGQRRHPRCLQSLPVRHRPPPPPELSPLAGTGA